jgi:hypothetical protein
MICLFSKYASFFTDAPKIKMIERPLYFLLLLVLLLVLCILSTILRILRFQRQATYDFQQASIANRNSLPRDTTRERIAEHLSRQWRERRRSSSLSSIGPVLFASLRSIGAITEDDEDASNKESREQRIQKAIISMKRQEGDQKVETRHPIIRRRSSLSFSFPRGSFSESTATDECVICLDPIKAGDMIATSSMNKCFHAFHEECIQIWLHEHDECPMCRRNWLSS